MKRLGSSDSLGALITSEEQNPRNHVYGRDHQMMLEGIVLDEEGCSVEELGHHHHHHSEKKRRLSVDQVKALEKNFEVENKLEPERKVKLAQELGLQPRQVAVWFQNRRARWKTKQLERDYGVLKANYDALKLNHDILHQDNQALLKEIKDLKSRLQEKSEEEEDESAVKEETSQPVEAECDQDENDEEKVIQIVLDNYECLNRNDVVLFSSDDSDTSAIVNEGNSPNNAGISTTSCFQFQKTSSYETTTQPQYVKMEEHNFFGVDDGEACNFFSEDQAPTLQWYWS